MSNIYAKQFELLKANSSESGALEDALKEGLYLLESIRIHYQNGSNNDPVYLECKEFCQKIINRIGRYIVVDNYKKRFDSLALPYNSSDPIPVPYTLQRTNIPQVSPANHKFEYKPKNKSLRKRVKHSQEFEQPSSYESNVLSKLAVDSMREYLLYEHRKKRKLSLIKIKDLQKIYGIKFTTLEGLLSILEEMEMSGNDVLKDPIFFKINNHFCSKLENLNPKDKVRYHKIEKQYENLMNKINFISKRSVKTKKSYLEIEDEDLDMLEPTNQELEQIEKH